MLVVQGELVKFAIYNTWHVRDKQPTKYRGLWLGADVKEGRGVLYTSTVRGCYARAISGTVIQYRQEKRAAEKGGPQHGDPQGR